MNFEYKGFTFAGKYIIDKGCWLFTCEDLCATFSIPGLRTLPEIISLSKNWIDTLLEIRRIE